MKTKSIYRTWARAEEVRRKTLRAIRRQGRRVPMLRIYRAGTGWAITSRPQRQRQATPYQRRPWRWEWISAN